MLSRLTPLCLLMLVASAANAADPPVVKIPRVDRAPALADFLEMKPNAAWDGRMAKIENFLQREPTDGKPASQKTEAYLGYDDKNLYVVFVCFDSEPGKIRAPLGRRESLFDDDVVGVFFDTFHDRQHAYEFFVNPVGTQADAIQTEGQGDDFSFDTLWHSQGKLTPQGYVVWLSIPFKSLRFHSGARQTWGFGVIRIIPRNNEQAFWPYNTRKVEGFTQQLATLEGLENISASRNVQLIPYGVFSAGRFRDTRGDVPRLRTSNDARIGLDAKVVLKDALTVDLAVNPDFSQVESDEPQVTVNRRFEVFFPEKRPFFIENAGFFQTPVNLFFSRRIGDPQFGARLTGKVGRWAVGALAADDRGPGDRVEESDPAFGQRAHFFLARANREWGKQSTVGVIYADREFFGSFNRVGGVDTRWKINKNWVFTGQALASATRQEGGSYLAGPAYQASVYRSGRKFFANAVYSDYSPGFRTQTGFLERSDIRSGFAEYGYTFRPEGKRLISWGPGSGWGITYDHHGTRLDWNAYNRLFFEFRGNTYISVVASSFRERLRPQDYSTLTANQDYSAQAYGAFFNSSYFKKVSIGGSLRKRKAINFDAPTGQAPFLGNSTSADASLTLRPISPLRIDNTYLLARLLDRGPGHAAIFNNHIIRSKWNWQFTRELSLRVILQYNTLLANSTYTSQTTTKSFNADFLATYLLNPGTAFYVGYNGNLQNLDRTGVSRTRSSFIQDGRVFFVKMSYLLRF